jgi:hypothetical protein
MKMYVCVCVCMYVCMYVCIYFFIIPLLIIFGITIVSDKFVEKIKRRILQY